MSQDIKTTVIDGHTYKMQMLAATKSYKLFHRLMKMLGPAFGQLFDVAKGAQTLGDVDLADTKTSNAIRTLMQDCTEEDVEHVINELKSVSLWNDKPLAQVFEAHFQGRPKALWEWVYWGIATQYQDFFDGLISTAADQGADVQELRAAGA